MALHCTHTGSRQQSTAYQIFAGQLRRRSGVSYCSSCPPKHTHTHTLLLAHAQRDCRFTMHSWATSLTTHPSAITSAQEVLQLSDANLMRDRLSRPSSRCGRSLVVCWLQFATRRGGSRGSRRRLGSFTASSTSLLENTVFIAARTTSKGRQARR